LCGFAIAKIAYFRSSQSSTRSRLAGLAVIGLPRAGAGLDRRGVLRQRNQPVAVEQPQQAGPIDAGERAISVAAEQVDQISELRREI